MKFPRYWARGFAEGGDFTGWGWSDVSVEEARARGRERAERMARRILGGEVVEHYPYGTGDRPLREEVLEEQAGGAGAPRRVVTRNAYGCRVLNTDRALFVDVDLDYPRPGLGFLLQRLFGGKPKSPRELAEAEALDLLRILVRRDPQIGARVYRTAGGLRYLFTHKTFDPLDSGTLGVLENLGADPLYIRLCTAQECFRARLTPKPWRCNWHALPVPWPWFDEKDAAAAARWIERYQKKAARHATCELIEHMGSTTMDPHLAELVAFHDRETGVGSGRPLA